MTFLKQFQTFDGAANCGLFAPDVFPETPRLSEGSGSKRLAYASVIVSSSITGVESNNGVRPRVTQNSKVTWCPQKETGTRTLAVTTETLSLPNLCLFSKIALPSESHNLTNVLQPTSPVVGALSRISSLSL